MEKKDKLKHHKGMEDAANDILNAESLYWGALLTFNGIIVAFFSIGIYTIQISIWLTPLIILVSLICSVLLIINFRDRLNWHYRKAIIFQVKESELDKVTDLLLKDSQAVSDRIKKRDPWIVRLLVIEIILLLTHIILRVSCQ